MLETNKIYCGDCIEVLKTFPDKCIDLILTDPPYDLEIDPKRYTGVYKTKGKHLDNIKENFGHRFNPIKFLDTVFSKSKNGLLVWHSKNLLKTYIDWAEVNNLKWNLMFWNKVNPIPAHYNHLLNDIEYCIRIYESGSYFNNDLKYEDYFSYYNDVVQQGNGHPTPKPMSIIMKQIQLFTKERDIVLDCFLGSGTTAVACKQLNRNYIGIEINPKYIEIAEKRLQQEVLALNK